MPLILSPKLGQPIHVQTSDGLIRFWLQRQQGKKAIRVAIDAPSSCHISRGPKPTEKNPPIGPVPRAAAADAAGVSAATP